MMTKEEIENLALLSGLCITEDNTEKLSEELRQMLDFAKGVNNALKDTDTVDIPDCSQASRLREDKVSKSADVSEILLNAPLKGDGYFIARKSEQDEQN